MLHVLQCFNEGCQICITNQPNGLSSVLIHNILSYILHLRVKSTNDFLKIFQRSKLAGDTKTQNIPLLYHTFYTHFYELYNFLLEIPV